MKESDSPEISSAWWKRHKPATLPATGLGNSLRAFEDARSKAEPSKDLTKFESVIGAYKTALKDLDAVDPAVERAIAKCNKVVHAACIKVLKKFGPLLAKEQARLDGELRSYSALLTSRIDKVEQDCQEIIVDIIKDVKEVEPKLAALDRIEREAADTRDDAAHAVAHKERNAAELELSVAESYVRDATRLFTEIKAITTRSETKTEKAWSDRFDRTLKCLDGKRMGALADRRANAEAPLGVALQSAEEKLESVKAAAKAVRQLADGADDVAGHFVAICEALTQRTIKSHQIVSARLREVGGMLENANFDAINFREQKDPEQRDPRLLAKSKDYLVGGIRTLIEAVKVLDAARDHLDGSVKKFPKLVDASDQRFKDPLEQLRLVGESLKDDAEEAKKLQAKAKKAKESFEKSLALVKGVLA